MHSDRLPALLTHSVSKGEAMNPLKGPRKQLFTYLATIAMVTMTLTMLIGTKVVVPLNQTVFAHAAWSTCHFKSPQGNTQHVIYIQFDNVHFTRDNPNVPSDLEQMPHLLNFMMDNGVVLSNHHTAQAALTSTGLLTTMTGVYPARHGIPLGNSPRYFKPDGTTGQASSLAYWTAPLNDPNTNPPTDTTFNLLSAPNTNAPASWVPYTRAGCNVGSVGMVNTVLEDTGQDISIAFGPNSPQAQEAKANPSQARSDFVGIAVHCAQGDTLCSSANNGRPDVLPNEPNGYSGHMALFGHQYVAPQISPHGPLTDLNGNVIRDSSGHNGFPGVEAPYAVSLAYAAAMQEHNIPVTYTYLHDIHDAGPNGPAYGPGQAEYVAALKENDQAFSKFFTRLANDGITPRNTLFVVTTEEGDRFVGSVPTPTNCDGITISCTYSKKGSLDVNLTGLLATKKGITTPFTVVEDAYPSVYITGHPVRDVSVTRTFERAVARMKVQNLITGKTEALVNYMADPVEMKLLHMITADPARTPTMTLFANPEYYVNTGAPNCNSPCVVEDPDYAWDHGTVAPELNTIWVGIVGPGVRQMGVNNNIWSDLTDVRPTMMMLLGLNDDYSHDGRVLFEALTSEALPLPIHHNPDFYIRFAQAYKQINAPFGELGLTTLKVSTTALASNVPNDAIYTNLEHQLQEITEQRDTIAKQMITLLEKVSFEGNESSSNNEQVTSLVNQAYILLNRASSLTKKQ
jgi:hypothetical protein